MTEDIESIAKRLVVGHKRDGRSIYDRQARSDLVQASRQPGVSLARIARICGINANVLSNWVRQDERQRDGSAAPAGDIIELPAAPAFVVVQVAAAPAPNAAAAPALDIHVRLPNGVTVELKVPDMDGASRLLEVLGRMRCSASTRT